MPNLDSVPITKYQPLHPYHHFFDNLPIEDIETQIFVVNSQVDNNQNQIENSIGSTGSLAGRLNKSLEDSGALKATAIDDALHSIGEHLDAGGFVRMTDAEQAKLSLVDSSATNLSIELDTISTTLVWPDVSTTFRLADSDTIEWRIDSGQVFADTTFAKSLITIPSYDITPISTGGVNYKTTSVSTAYKAGTLRVYINGLRLTETGPTIGGFYYAETTPASGTFALNKVVDGSDILRIDFDQPIS